MEKYVDAIQRSKAKQKIRNAEMDTRTTEENYLAAQATF